MFLYIKNRFFLNFNIFICSMVVFGCLFDLDLIFILKYFGIVKSLFGLILECIFG